MAVPKTSCIVYETPNCDCPCQERKGVCICGHTCGQKPPKPQPCKIYLPPKPKPGIFDDLRHLNILKLIGDLLSFLLLFLLLLTLLELLIFHFLTSHGAFKLPETIPPKILPRFSKKPDLPPKTLPKIQPEKETEDHHYVEPKPKPPPPDAHYVPETIDEPPVPVVQDPEVAQETDDNHEVRQEQFPEEPDDHDLTFEGNLVYTQVNPHPAPVPEKPRPVLLAPVSEKPRQAKCEPPCQNGGTCRLEPKTGASTCVCPQGKGGASCEMIICQPPCQNGGKCIVNPTNPNGGNLCMCPPGRQGDVCQEEVEVPKEKEEEEEPQSIVDTIISGDAFHKKNLKLPNYEKPKIAKPETKWTIGIPKIAAQPEATSSGQDLPQMKFPEKETGKNVMKFPEADLPHKAEVKKEKADCEKESDEAYFKNLFWG